MNNYDILFPPKLRVLDNLKNKHNIKHTGDVLKMLCESVSLILIHYFTDL